jgi:acyl-coenzyme A synthetase/AMP-(fatty) acid ligase
MLVACARSRPDTTVLSGPDGPGLTAAGLLMAARRGAGALAGRGVRRGNAVAIDTLSLRWHEVAVAYFSVGWLGASAVLTMSRQTERVAVERLAPAGWVGRDGGPATGWRLSPADLADGATVDGEPAAEPDDRLDVVFTSGTTGLPKPVASTHAQWAGSVRSELLRTRARRVVGHTGIPVGVSGGLHGVLLNHVARGVTSVHAETAAELVETCAGRRVDELHLTPHSARGVADRTRPDASWARGVGTIRVVGGPLPGELAELLAERFPAARLVSIYALTEGGSALCVKLVGRDGARQDSIGRPAADTEVRVLGPDGQPLPPGEVGELAVRTAGSAALSYVGEDQLNREWFPAGWARTGDLGRIEPDGEIRLVGRVKELLFLRGGRLPPEFVEDILARHTRGLELAVTGLPTPGGWDRIAAFLVGTEEDPAVRAAADRLAGMRGPFRPDVVRVVPEIPRGPFGKPLRRLLTDRLADATAAVTTAELPRLNGDAPATG